MRVLTEEETQIFFEKLTKFLGSNVKFLIDRDDGDFVFRLHRARVPPHDQLHTVQGYLHHAVVPSHLQERHAG